MQGLIQEPVFFGTENERSILLVAYVLFFVGLFTAGLVSVAGVVICHIKCNEVSAPALQSHYRWLIRSFWFGVLWSIILWGCALTVIGLVLAWPGFVVLGIWFLYRIIRGALAWVDRKPLP